MKHLKKTIIGLLVLLVTIPLIGFGTLYYKLNSIYDKEEADQVKKDDKVEKIDGITNILLVGVDGENVDRGNRSDAMMILTIDSDNNDVRLTSLARDTYVDIPGFGTEKLTHAYAYDGPSLLLETIKNNFGIYIDKYVSVSFSSFISIIDELGGVEIDITDKEVNEIPGVEKAGNQPLTGEQALAYSRIRYIDSAYQRDSRQRTVLQALYSKLSSIPKTEFLDITNILLRYTKTNMTPIDIISISNQALKTGDKEFDELEFPLEGHRTGRIINDEKGWVIEWEKDYNKDAIYKFIFDYKDYIKEYE